MASYSTAGPDSPITVKVLYDGCTRRAKLALRDMVPVVLQEKVALFPFVLYIIQMHPAPT